MYVFSSELKYKNIHPLNHRSTQLTQSVNHSISQSITHYFNIYILIYIRFVRHYNIRSKFLKIGSIVLYITDLTKVKLATELRNRNQWSGTFGVFYWLISTVLMCVLVNAIDYFLTSLFCYALVSWPLLPVCVQAFFTMSVPVFIDLESNNQVYNF